jgi:hypothetical protein
MFRIEVDATTGDVVQIPQKAYRNASGQTLVLDATESPPAGFTEFTPILGPTYKQSLDALNAAYQMDVSKFNNAFALALLSDGPSEATKIAAIRTQYEERRTKHVADLAALKTQYGV